MGVTDFDIGDKQMKVLFINTVFGKGSTGRIVKDIGETLEKEGHEYVALYGREPINNDSHAVFIGNPNDARIHAGLSRITDKCGFYSKNATQKAIEFIKKYNPDVIHLHNLHGYYINIELLFLYLKNEYQGKIIWTLHDCWAFTGHCVHYTYAKCCKWKTGCYHCPEKKRYPASIFFDNSQKNYRKKQELFTGLTNLTIVTPSDWLANQVKESFLREYNCVVVNNGIDIEVFCPQKKENKRPYVLNVLDGLDERKGFSDLVKISEAVSGKYDVVVIGVSEKEAVQVPASIKAVCRTNSQQELAQYYSNADYFVNTTYEDTFPTVNIEALACGTPVITYRSGGSPEIIDYKSGITVEPGDYEAIITILMNNKAPTEEMCRKRAMNYNKWDKYAEYINLYLGQEKCDESTLFDECSFTI